MPERYGDAGDVASPGGPGVAPLGATLAVVFFASLGTGVFWNAIGFVAKHGYGFSSTRTLVLAVVMGAVYAAGAFAAGRVVRALRVSPRTLLAAAFLVEAALCLLPTTFAGEWALWVATTGVSLASAVIWPVIESYLTTGRHGAVMRRAIGLFNVVWMTAVAVPLFAMAPILESHAAWAITGQAAACVLCLWPIRRFPARPPDHDHPAQPAHVPGEYRALLRSARVLLPMSYILMAAMSPLLPYRFEAIGAPVTAETPATATWMIVRVLAVLVMWSAGFWHGRWGTLLFGGLAMSGGFTVVILAPSVAVILLGFVLFGVGLAVVYYAALYYAMAVGRAEVDASGVHEGLIGLGYAIGPAAALGGASVGGGGAIVTVLLVVMAGLGIAAAWPYRQVRRRRPSV